MNDGSHNKVIDVKITAHIILANQQACPAERYLFLLELTSFNENAFSEHMHRTEGGDTLNV